MLLTSAGCATFWEEAWSHERDFAYMTGYGKPPPLVVLRDSNDGFGKVLLRRYQMQLVCTAIELPTTGRFVLNSSLILSKGQLLNFNSLGDVLVYRRRKVDTAARSERR